MSISALEYIPEKRRVRTTEALKGKALKGLKAIAKTITAKVIAIATAVVLSTMLLF